MKDEHFQLIMNIFTKKLTIWAERFMSHEAKDSHKVSQAMPWGFSKCQWVFVKNMRN
jgi:uncharacterized membrane protein